MKEVLILTGRYLPKLSPNGICINNIISRLPADQYRVTCICYDDGQRQTIENADIIRVSRGFIKTQLYRHEGENNLYTKILKIADKIKMSLFFFQWPWTDPIFTGRVYKIAKKLYSKRKFDFVIAVHMPLSSLIVGKALKKKYASIRFVPYFLDSLSGGNPLACFSDKWNLKKKLKWERKILPYADKIVVMESHRRHHERYSADMPYYRKFVYLDIPLLQKVEKNATKNPYDPSKINILFCGTATLGIRNMQYFSLLAKQLENTEVQFSIIGVCDCIELLQLSNISYYPLMSHEELLPFLSHADLFINFGVKTPSAISGKIFEYMSYGKPIVSTYSIDEEACLPYLKKYPKALLIDEREPDIRQQAENLLSFARNRAISIDFDEVSKLFSKNTSDAFIKQIFNEREYDD